MDTQIIDRLAIRDLIDNWAIWRDSGDWERFSTVWAKDSWISATWFQGMGEDFIRVAQEGWNRGVSILHFLGGTSIELAGARAWAQTKMTINQRADVHGVECDVICTARFHDLLEKQDGHWRRVVRQPTYENDIWRRSIPRPPSRSIKCAQTIIDWLSASSLLAAACWLYGETRHAGFERRGRRRALCSLPFLAPRRALPVD